MSQVEGVYVSGNFSEPMSAQHNFANEFDLEDPNKAMSVYARYVSSASFPPTYSPLTLTRIMHEHTKRQLNIATSSARRRSQEPNQNPSSSTASVSSTGS